MDVANETRDEALVRLKPAEAQQLIELLRRVHANLSERVPQPSAESGTRRSAATARRCRASGAASRCRCDACAGCSRGGRPVTHLDRRGRHRPQLSAASCGERRGRRAVAGRRRPLRQRLRLPLMLAGPIVVLLAAGCWYLTGGRYVSTDDAYVQAARTMISTDVSGRVVEVDVKRQPAGRPRARCCSGSTTGRSASRSRKPRRSSPRRGCRSRR